MYEYTRPRGPIASQFKSPGPCYGLPSLVGYQGHDPRSVHNKRPAWHFGTKHGSLVDDCSPGPVHKPNDQTTRYGKDGTPSYSLYGRPRDLTSFQVPAPGTYEPQHSGPSAYPHAPAHSFGDRTRLRGTDTNPAPNSYTLPSLLGKTIEGGKRQAPIFSQRGRNKFGGFSEDLQKTPGPGCYGTNDPNATKRRAPSYTLRSRSMMPGDGTRKPGPGSHSPEHVYINKKIQPKFSFGIRHSEYTTPLIINVE